MLILLELLRRRLVELLRLPRSLMWWVLLHGSVKAECAARWLRWGLLLKGRGRCHCPRRTHWVLLKLLKLLELLRRGLVELLRLPRGLLHWPCTRRLLHVHPRLERACSSPEALVYLSRGIRTPARPCTGLILPRGIT